MAIARPAIGDRRDGRGRPKAKPRMAQIFADGGVMSSAARKRRFESALADRTAVLARRIP
jgi:hypothetical protein